MTIQQRHTLISTSLDDRFGLFAMPLRCLRFDERRMTGGTAAKNANRVFAWLLSKIYEVKKGVVYDVNGRVAWS